MSLQPLFYHTYPPLFKGYIIKLSPFHSYITGSFLDVYNQFFRSVFAR